MSYKDFDPNIVLSDLKKFAEYDLINGGLVATVKRRSDSPNIGEQIGSLHGEGYRHVQIDGFKYMLHDLVYLWHYEKWPNQIDHINGNRADNRIENLRSSTYQVNASNKAIQSNNTSGYTGVSFRSTINKYEAYVWHNRKKYHCGYHNIPEEAYEARQTLIAAHPEWNFTARHGQ